MKKIVALLLGSLLLFTGCASAGGGNTTGGGNKENQDDIGMTIQEAMANKDFVGPDNVSPIDKNIYIGIQSRTKVFDAEEEVGYYVMVLGELEEDLDLTIGLESDFTGKKSENTHALKAGREQQTIAGKISGESLGILRFHVTAKNGAGETVMDQSKDVAVMQTADKPSEDAFYWGVQPFTIRSLEYNEEANGPHCFEGLTPEETYERTFEYIDMTGANLIRDGMVWTSNQPSQSVFNFALMDRLIADAKEKGYVLDWHLGGTPDWAVTERFKGESVKWNKPPTLDAWQSYVDRVASLYAEQEHVIIEIINECNWPDFFYGTAQEYIDILDASYETFADTGLTVINGGMVMPQANNYVTEESEKFTFAEDGKYYQKYGELYKSGKLPYVAYHSHANFQTFIEKDSVNMMYYLQDAGIPQEALFLNESGMFNADGALQADDVIKKALWTKCNDHKGFVLFNFRDIEGGVLSPPGWGIITQDGQPKESYPAYTYAIAALSGYRNKHVYANTLYNAYLMDNGTNNILVLFKDKSVPEAEVSLPDGYKAYDMFGNEIAGKIDKIGNNPVYVVFDGQADPSDIGLTIPQGYKINLSEYGRIDNFPDQ